MAKIITETAVLTSGYHKHISPLKKLVPMARLTRAEKADGAIVVILPTDHVIWSKSVADIVMGLSGKVNEKQGKPLEIWTSGAFSKLAEKNLKQMGWQVHTKARSQLVPTSK